MNTKTPLIGAAALLLGTSASATVLFGPAVSGLNNADGSSASGSSKTIAIIDVDGDGISGFNLGSWDGSSFLPDGDDIIVPGWNEATGDGDGFEASVPDPFDNSTLDVSSSPYSLTVATNAGNTPGIVGGGDHVFLFFFPDLAPAAASPGGGTSFGVVDLGALPDGFGSLTPNLVGPGSDYRATFATTGGGIPGDFDGDGDVDGVDVSTMFTNFNGPGGGVPNNPATDLDGDGDCDGVDIAAIFAAFTGPLAPASVPEPTSLALLGLGGLLVARRRRA